MKPIENMTRDELIELIEAAKAGKLQLAMKCWYFINGKLYKKTKKEGIKLFTIEQFKKISNVDDIIISFEDIDLDKHPHLKGKFTFLGPSKQASELIELL